MDPENIQWDQIINKKARGVDEYDLGEVQGVTPQYVLTRTEVADKKLFQIPKKLVISFDGNKIIFNLNEYDANSFYLKETKLVEEQIIPSSHETTETINENILYEKVTKAPTKEIQANIQLVYEELVIEQKRLSKPQKISEDDMQSSSKMSVALKREEIELNEQ